MNLVRQTRMTLSATAGVLIALGMVASSAFASGPVNRTTVLPQGYSGSAVRVQVYNAYGKVTRTIPVGGFERNGVYWLNVAALPSVEAQFQLRSVIVKNDLVTTVTHKLGNKTVLVPVRENLKLGNSVTAGNVLLLPLTAWVNQLVHSTGNVTSKVFRQWNAATKTLNVSEYNNAFIKPVVKPIVKSVPTAATSVSQLPYTDPARYGLTPGEAVVLSPPPKGFTLAQWDQAVQAVNNADALDNKCMNSPNTLLAGCAQIANALNTTTLNGAPVTPGETMLSTATQWYNDPSDVFFNKSFPVKDLRNGFIFQRKPLVEVSSIQGSNNNHGMSYLYVEQYVGKGVDTGGAGPETWWLSEQVSTINGEVMSVSPYVTSNSLGDHIAMQAPAGQGFDFGIGNANGSVGGKPINPTWAVGLSNGVAANYAVPLPLWIPNK